MTYEFSQANFMLNSLLMQMEADLHTLTKNSVEKYHVARERLIKTWEEWPTHKENFRTAVNNLPTELKKRDFLNHVLKDLEHFEENTKPLLTRLKETRETYKTSLSAKYDSWQPQITKMHEHSQRISAQVRALPSHPLISKFLKGETILASRSKMQWGRKLGHMFCGVSFLYLFEFSNLPKFWVWTFFILFMIWGFSLEVARHMSPKINNWVCKAFRPIMREREKNKINSGIFFMFSMSVVYFLFPRDVAFLTMLFIALGDPIAGIVGVTYGKHKLSKHSSLEGVLACFTLCVVLTFVSAKFFFNQYHITGFALVPFSVLGGVIACVAESAFKKLDDNLVMPLVSAPLLYVLLSVFA